MMTPFRVPARLAVLVCAGLALAACVKGPRMVHADTPIPEFTLQVDPSADIDTAPTMISGRWPVFPIERAFSGESGSASIAYTIGSDGHTRDFEVLSATQPVFADHLIIAVRNWTFRPAQKDGHPVDLRARQDFRFDAR